VSGGDEGWGNERKDGNDPLKEKGRRRLALTKIAVHDDWTRGGEGGGGEGSRARGT